MDSLQARNFVVAFYTVSLTLGETLLLKKIRYDTLKGYVRLAIKCHTDRRLPSPRLADTDYITVILDAVRKYQKVPDRREMIHDSMYEHLLERYAEASRIHPDAQPAALMEWLFLGRWVGPRKSEWCGESATSWRTIDDPEWGDRPNALPFIFEDFRFLSASGQEIFITKEHWSDPHLAPPKELAYVELRVRKQKNNDNYQKLLYARLPTDSPLCPVRCAFRIFCRGKRLGIASTHPAAVFATRAKLEPFHLITGVDVCKLLRKTARVVFALKSDDPSLRLWSSHSLRVTACNLLHRAKFSDSYIKNRLRWKSDSFLMYLRNTFYTADEHSKALDLGIHPTAHECRALENHEVFLSQAAAGAA